MALRVISGGQCGVDQASLRAAKRSGLETGGWAPKGFRTMEGPCPWLGSEFGLQEHKSEEYPPRTEANVRDSDATVWFGWENSPGFACTQRAITKTDKPFWKNPRDPEELAFLIRKHEIQTLNVAGNRPNPLRPTLGEYVEDFLVKTFSMLQY